jgi:class 3 adenylate cyclase
MLDKKKSDSKRLEELKDKASSIESQFSTFNEFRRQMADKDLPHFISIRDRLSSLTFSDESAEKQLKLQEEINELKKKYRRTYHDLEQANIINEDARQQLESIKNELKAKEQINHILPRLCEQARKKLLEDTDFRLQFEDASNCEAVVVSIDIRRSTELMLKARKPEMFSKFITELSQKLSEAILSNFGVFDKFTGDGILAFFPRFYSGEHAIVRALKAAEECHSIFSDHYNESRGCFNVFIKDVGLGIGIDYGTVTLVNTRNELTVVGIPVVYACRMGGAKAGQTLLNQPALEEIHKVYAGKFKAKETEINIKNEGTALAYEVVFNDDLQLQAPEWLDGIKDAASTTEPVDGIEEGAEKE